jgi:hypothetical protein
MLNLPTNDSYQTTVVSSDNAYIDFHEAAVLLPQVIAVAS